MLTLVRMVIVLTLLCLVSGFSLSYLKMTTAKTIEEQVLTYVQGPAILQVFPDITNSPILDRKTFKLDDGSEVNVFPAKRGDKLVGVAIENFSKAYGGDLGVMVGYDVQNDKLVGIGITTSKETPGLGTQVAEPKFAKQFVNSILDPQLRSQGGQIDAVSGATISSAATVNAVNKATVNFLALKDEILASFK